MLKTFYSRFARRTCVLALLVTPVLLIGAKGAFESNRNDVLDWLPSSFEETQRLQWFVERFGSDEILVLSWPGCTLEDTRLDVLSQQLVRPRPGVDPARDEVWFRQVFTGRQTLAEFTSEPLSLTSVQAVERMKGWLLGTDGETTCAVALVSIAGSLNRESAVWAAYDAALACGIDRSQLRMGGPTADGAAINEASQRWIVPMGLASAFWGLLVAFWCLRDIRLVAVVFLTATFAWGISLSILFYSGHHMDAVLMMMPALVFVLSVSGAIHLTHYYLKEAAVTEPGSAVANAMSQGWLPCSLASSTTAIGLGALAVSKVTPVARFGLFAGIGVLATLLSLLLLWPAIVQWWIVPRGNRSRALPNSRPARHNWWWPFFQTATRQHVAVLLLVGAAIPILSVGASRIRTSTDLNDLLSRRSRLLQDYDWLREHLGALVPLEIVLEFDRAAPDDAAEMLKRAEIVEQLRRYLAALPETQGTVALTTFAPELPEPSTLRQIMRRNIVARRLRNHRDRYQQLRFLADDGEHELWRVSTRVLSSTEVDYGRFLGSLGENVEAFLKSETQQTGESVAAKICGGVPLIHMAQEQLLRDLIESFASAFLLITVTMVILMRSLAGGVLSMIPNVFPALMVFGFMGWAGSPIDIGAMMTASAALGIAVDDTLHFLVWYRRGLRQRLPRRDAIHFAYRHCATAMLQTTIICGLGLVVFAVSPFMPIARFAVIMTTLLLAALLGDLVLLPALLVGRLGGLFGTHAGAADQS